MKKILFWCCMLMVAVLYACPFSSEENGYFTNRFIYISGINAPDNHCSGMQINYNADGGTGTGADGITHQYEAITLNYTTKHPQNIAPPLTIYIAYAYPNPFTGFEEGLEMTNELDNYKITLSVQISKDTKNWTTVTSRTFKNWYHPLFSTTGKAILGRYTVPASAFSPLGGNYYLRLRIVAQKMDKYGQVISYVDNTSNNELTYYHTQERTGTSITYNSSYNPDGTIYRSYFNNPFSNFIWYPSDGSNIGAINSFNPAQSVYLKITSARRPTHE